MTTEITPRIYDPCMGAHAPRSISCFPCVQVKRYEPALTAVAHQIRIGRLRNGVGRHQRHKIT